MSRRRTLLPSLFALAAAWTPSPARAAPELALRPARVEQVGRFVTVTVGYPDLFDAALAAKLDSGFAMNLVARVTLYREGSTKPETLALRTFRVAYDLWDEVYLIEERDEAGVRDYRVKSRGEAIARVTALERLPLADAAWLDGQKRYHAEVLVEVNPVSAELMAQVRRWLSQPRAGHRWGEGESFFGSLVSIFVNPRVGDAEKVLAFRTPRFLPPTPPATAPPLGPPRATDGRRGGAE